MRDYRLLLKLVLCNRLAGLRSGSWRKENGKLDVGSLVGTAVVALALMALAGFVIYAEISMFSLLKTFRQEALLPALAMLLSLFSTLLLSFFQVLSGLYFSKDTVWMAYLPVRSRSVMAAKMTEIWFWEELVAWAVLLPIFILYGIHLGGNVLYYFRMALVVLLAPTVPLCIVAFFTSLLARVSSLSRHKEALGVIFSIALMLLIWGLEGTLVSRIPEDADAMYFIRLLLDHEGILTMLTSAFPPVLWAIHGLQGDIGQLLLYILLCAGCIALMLALLGGGYLNICLRQAEQGTKKRRLRTSEKTYQQRSPLLALFTREWFSVVKSPTIALNSLMGIFMFPIMFGMMFVGIASVEPELNFGDFLSEITGLLSEVSPLDVALVVAAAVGFATFMNPAVGTAVTREGSRLAISKMLPVSVRVQMLSKLLVGALIDFLGVAMAMVIMIALFPGLAGGILLGGLLAMILCLASSAMSLTMDAVRPNLHWTNETQAIKGANVAIGMIISLAAFALPVIPAVCLLSSTPLARFASVVGVLVLETVLGFVLLRFVGEKRYAAIEPAS